MPDLPSRFAAAMLTFTPLFLQRSWRCAEVLLAGAILAPGQRTVTSILCITGLAQERRFVNHHRVLNLVAWCLRAAARLLLGMGGGVRRGGGRLDPQRYSRTGMERMTVHNGKWALGQGLSQHNRVRPPHFNPFQHA